MMMLTKHKISILLVVASIALGGCDEILNNIQKEAEQKTNKVVAGNQKPTATLSAKELYDAFESNEIKANSEYKGKVIAVTGVVSAITTSLIGDQPIVSLTATSNEHLSNLQTVTCTFAKVHSSSLASLSKGTTITMIGLVTGKMMGPRLTGCRLK